MNDMESYMFILGKYCLCILYDVFWTILSEFLKITVILKQIVITIWNYCKIGMLKLKYKTIIYVWPIPKQQRFEHSSKIQFSNPCKYVS